MKEEQEIWKPAVRFGKTIPGYFVSNKGRVRSRTGRILRPRTTYSISTRTLNKRPNCMKLELNIPKTLFSDEYVHRCRTDRKNSLSFTVSVHRLVMETFKPIEDNLPMGITKEEWSICSDSIKKFISSSSIVDHIDDDPTNNNVDNLRWVTPVENNNHRKRATTKGLVYTSKKIEAETQQTNEANIDLDEFLV